MKYNKLFTNILILFIVLISFLTYNYLINTQTTNIIEKQKQISFENFQTFDKSLQVKLDNFKNSIVSIKNNSKYNEFLQDTSNQTNETYVNELFLAIALNSPDLFQLRYLDSTGKEIIRVDKKDNKVQLAKDLQDKSDRYYFINTKITEKNQFWYSYFDLNMEYGKIEQPLKPTLRVASPVYTNDKFNGILIVNIDMTNTLNELFANYKQKKVLVDSNNEILFSNDASLGNWSKYLGTEKFDDNLYTILIENRVNLHNDEKLSLKIYYDENDLEELISEYKISLVLVILILDIISLIFLFILYRNSFLTQAINKELEKSKDLLDKINSFEIMSKTDIDGNITYVTDEFCRLSGYSKEELIGNKHSLIKDNQVDPKVYEELWQTISKGEVFHTKLPIISKSGERRYWDINIYPQKDEYGKIIEYIAYRRDETAQTLLRIHNEILEQEVEERTKKLNETVLELHHTNENLSNINEELSCTEEELRAQQDELMENQEKILELSKTKEQFLSNMSLEIRTPLNGIVGITDILLDEDNLGKNVVDKLNIIKSSSRILNTVVNDILDYTALQAGKIKIFEKEFDFRNMIKNIEMLMRPEIESKDLTFIVDIDERIKDTLIGDEFRLQQIIINLLSNARKFTEHGYVKLAVTCSSIDNEYIKLRFTVVDSGIGMDEEVKKNVFTAFSQSDKSNTSKHRGTGLGLAICENLVDIMNGQIWFNSEINNGTTMFFSLKLKYNDRAKTQKENILDDKLVKLANKKKALLVEDDVVNQVVAKTMLEKIGFEVRVVNNGLEAVDSCKSYDFDIIFMDIQMPIMNGYEATIKIKEFNQDIPIVALSAGALQEDIYKSHEVGMNNHIVKPILINELNSVVEEYFEIQKNTKTKTKENSLNHLDKKLINYNELTKVFDDETIKEFFELFKENYENYEKQLDSKNQIEVRNYIHKLKGACGNLKFTSLYTLCDQYELVSTLQQDKIVQEIKSELKELLKEINKY